MDYPSIKEDLSPPFLPDDASGDCSRDFCEVLCEKYLWDPVPAG